MKLIPERLIEVRKSLGINKSGAAKLLNTTAMSYGRYENGKRMPSYQTLCFMAQTFNTSPEYLCGETGDPEPAIIIIEKEKEHELFEMVDYIKRNKKLERRLLAYYKLLFTEKISRENQSVFIDQ